MVDGLYGHREIIISPNSHFKYGFFVLRVGIGKEEGRADEEGAGAGADPGGRSDSTLPGPARSSPAWG